MAELLVEDDFAFGFAVVFTGVFVGVLLLVVVLWGDALSGVALLVLDLFVVALLFVAAVDLVAFDGVFVLLLCALVADEPVTAPVDKAEVVTDDTVALDTGAARVADIGSIIMELCCNCTGGGLIIAWYSFFGNGAHAARK